MVTFAPEEQQMQAPQYWFMSRPISNVTPDTSKEILLKGAATALEGGVNVAQNFVEGTILHEEHQGLDNINQQAIERLNAAKANPALIDKDAQELPSAVKGLPKDLDQLDQARAHGKLSQTYIDMQKYQLAQTLRSRYAGHRDFIDETFAKSNREDPANKLVGSLIGDINSMAAASDSKKMEFKALAVDALKKGYPQADVMVSAAMKGNLNQDKFLSWYYQNSSKEAAEKHEDIELRRTEANNKFAGQVAEETMTNRLHDRAVDFFYNHQTATPGLQTPSEILEWSRKLAAGEVQPDDESAQKKMLQIEQARQQFEIEADKMLDEHKPGELSYRSLMGEAKAKGVKESAVQRFTQLGKLFSDEHTGAGHAALLITKAQTEDTKYQLFNPPPGSKDDDATARFLRIFAAIGHDAAPETLNNLMKGALVTGNIDEVLQRKIAGQNMAGVAQPDGPNNPTTIKATVDELNNNKAVSKLSKEQKAEAYKQAFSNIDILTDSKSNVTDKQNVTTQFFHPNNRKLLGSFDVPSQMKLWGQLTNDKVAAQMHKLGGQYYNWYSGWVRDTFGTQLFPESINTLNKFGDLSNIKVTYDNKESRFNVLSAPTKVRGGGELPDPELREVQEAVKNLNTGLSSVHTLASYEGEDTNAYILKLLLDSGINKGLVDGMTKAVVSSGKEVPKPAPEKKQPEKKEDTPPEPPKPEHDFRFLGKWRY